MRPMADGAKSDHVRGDGKYRRRIGAGLVTVAFLASVFAVMALAEVRTETSVAPPLAKGALLRRPETQDPPYAVVETRGDGVLVLKRVRQERDR